MKTVKMRSILMTMLLLFAIVAACSPAMRTYAATGYPQAKVDTRWTKLCDTKENRVQYVRIEAKYPVNLDVKMNLSGGKTWSENNAVRVKPQGVCVRDFYVGKNVQSIWVRVNAFSTTHYGKKETYVTWKNVGSIRLN